MRWPSEGRNGEHAAHGAQRCCAGVQEDRVRASVDAFESTKRLRQRSVFR